MSKGPNGSARTLRWERSRFVIALLSMIAGSCESSSTKTGAATPNVDRQSTVESKQLDSSSVSALQLDSLTEIELGDVTTQFPVRVSSLHVAGNRIAVIDKGGRAVRMYDRSGRHLFSVATNRAAPNLLLKPEALRIQGDSLFVMDMSHKRGVAVVDMKGQVARVITLPANASMTGLDVGDSIVATASLLLDTEVKLPGARFVFVSTTSGRAIARICAPDAMYAASLERRGFLALFRNIGVRKYADRLYCMQPVSPVIQIFSVAGDSIGTIDVVPPFYRRGKDAPQSMDQLAINRFTSTWTENVDFFPFENGFLSVYTHFDSTKNRRLFELFRCTGQNAGNYHCAMAQSTLQPLALIGSDTIASVIYDRRANSPPRLRFNRLR